ncbi:MAG: hypothetical protein WCK67_11560 [bacterium]
MSENQGPSLFELKNFIINKKIVSFHLLNDKVITGNIIWHDVFCFHVKTDTGQEITVLKSAIAFYTAIS